MRHILVTGGGGYIGGRLVPRLLQRGNRVRVLDRFWFSDPEILEAHSRLQIIPSDLRDACKLRESLYGVDTVIHLAAINEASASHLSPDLVQQINGVAHERLVRGAKQQGVRRLLFVSTTSVYGNPEAGDLDEGSPRLGNTPYLEIQKTAEDVVLSSGSRDTFSTAVFRAPAVWGTSPRMRREQPLNGAIQDALIGRPVSLPHPKRYHPCIFLDDLVEVLVRSVEIPSDLLATQLFNAIGGNPTWGDVGRQLARLAKVCPTFGEFVPPGPQVLGTALRQRLGLCPRTTLEDGMAQMAGLAPSGLEARTLEKPEQNEPQDGDRSYSPG